MGARPAPPEKDKFSHCYEILKYTSMTSMQLINTFSFKQRNDHKRQIYPKTVDLLATQGNLLAYQSRDRNNFVIFFPNFFSNLGETSLSV